MWDKIKKWWSDRKQRQQEKLNKMWHNVLGVPPWVKIEFVKEIYPCSYLLLSIYFEEDREWVAVDFSQWENTGVAHFMIFTKDSMDKYDKDLEPKKYITTFAKNATVYLKEYADGSCGWCFSS